MKSIQLTILSSMVILASVFAEASRDITIRLGQHTRGPSKIFLKQEIKRINPGINLQNKKIVSVRMVAKSKHGQGTAQLMVNGRMKDQSRIYGTPREFNRPGPRTFDRFDLVNRGGSQGAWQIHLRGNIKVRKVVVTIERRRGGNGGGRIVAMGLGGDKADKGSSGNGKTYPIRERTQTIVITGTKSKVEIMSAIVTYGNGSQEYLTELEGSLKSGRTKSANIGGRRVQSVRVRARSPRLFESRGKYQVTAHVIR